MIQNQINFCAQVTELLSRDTFRLVNVCLSRLGDSYHFKFAKVKCLVAYGHIRVFLEKNIHIMDILTKGYERNGDIALSYGAISKECICCQNIAKYVLKSDHMKKFFITFNLQI